MVPRPTHLACPQQVITKTSLMLGVGEAPADVETTLRDLRAVGCDVVTFGQYLRPSKRHMPMREYITPEAFEEWQRVAEVSHGGVRCLRCLTFYAKCVELWGLVSWMNNGWGNGPPEE